MLLKVNPYNWNLGTIEIKKYIEQLSPPYHFESILDNEEGYLFILLQNKKMIGWDCKKNRIIYGIHRFKIKIDNLYFWKQMTSFHQNNSLIANKIRTHVIRQFKYQSSCIHQTNTVIGIGGEYYVYFPFILGTNYIGISNHSCIIEDAIFNSRLYIQNDTHHLINYNNIETFPILDISKRYFVIINISSIHQNQIEWIKDIDIEKLVIITCHSYHSKFPLLLKYFKCVGIKSFQNISGYVYILTFIKKIKYISLGSNCSVTYHLNKLGLRKKSYPFDWCRIHIHQIIDVLEHQFYLYEKIENSILSELFLNSESESTLLLTNSYGIKFAHEIKDRDKIELFEEKIKQRIKRFFDLKNDKDKIRFVRIEMSKIKIGYFEKLLQLVRLLETYINHFECIIILHYPNKIPIFHPKIKFFKFDSFSSDWKMEHMNWKSFLCESFF